ncbi:hypothetical protein [Brachyspira hyodysenteriae]|uniref:hypothetical protein n=1 Tax=Brachyspira hyodysenteriae TaxID=159 RepID=UPI0022CD75A0|nr:hypothetical protein [Brachyspira hyodysenteriae]MCZ9850171.1 hypothetical protein [Brachyspira hyodysenteriae]MCZ9894590.1 hypothetical protein [Brachyspira hyodysenteriae]MCZ9951885.1 hypothetical protein [Brachyspira hyodysenteriae]MCZ9970790.1 hypothetical protein [Brachyspira hyodysenteriae]MCZ9974957.1 hypothetical protein [Brachyspira hyodysenteriae]
MTLLQSFSFTVNTEGTFAEQYPDLRTGFYTQQITIGNNSYTFKIFPNFYMENVDISILNEAEEVIISNIPFNISEGINYLIGDISFNNYKLIYNMKKQQFELYSLP